MRPNQKSGSKSLLKEFLSFFNKIKKKDKRRIQYVGRKCYRYHEESGRIEIKHIDEHTSTLTLFGDGCVVQEVKIYHSSSEDLRVILAEIKKKNAAVAA